MRISYYIEKSKTPAEFWVYFSILHLICVIVLLDYTTLNRSCYGINKVLDVKPLIPIKAWLGV